SEAWQACLLCQRPPGRPPATQVAGWIEASHAVVDHLLTAEGELGSKSGKDVVRRLYPTQTFGPPAQPSQGRRCHIRKGNNPLACLGLGLSYCQCPCEQVNIRPLQSFQLASSCGWCSGRGRRLGRLFPTQGALQPF